MANIKEGLKHIWKLEFGDNPEKFLHRNQGEQGWTLGGVYQKANPYGIDWGLIEWANSKLGTKRASNFLYYDKEVQRQVTNIYQKRYWNALKLDQVHSQHIANEIFVMGVVAGLTASIKIAQRVVGVVDDGIIGRKTLHALNSFDVKEFDKKFDKNEVEYFEGLARQNPKFKPFLRGWINRSMHV